MAEFPYKRPLQMTGYTKLFGTIVASTIWREEKETKIVWITMLAMANKDGMVEASIPGLADMARVSVPEVEKALVCLEGPDQYSRTKDHEGRRIQAVDGGWFVLNHAKYRAKMNLDERREYFRLKKQEQRAASKGVHKCPSKSKTVKDKSTPSTQPEAYSQSQSKTDSEPPREGGVSKAKGTLEELRAFCLELSLSESDGDWLFDKWNANGWKNGNAKILDWRATIRSWKAQGYIASQKASRFGNGRRDPDAGTVRLTPEEMPKIWKPTPKS